MNERAALYARVSSARQEQEKTIGSQLEALEQAASALGFKVAAEHRYVDDGFSGSRLDRPGMDRLRDAAADGLIDVVLVFCPDRLARNFVHQQVLVEELTKRGVRTHFIEHPIGDRAEDRLLMQMQGVIAEYERAKIVERTRRGRQHKVRTGQVLPFSRAPFGYAIVRTPGQKGGTVVVNEAEAEHVRAMYRWVLDENLSSRQVAKRLNKLGVRPQRARIWVAGSVYIVLTNPLYAGMATFGKRAPAEPKKPRRPGAYRKQANSSHVIRPKEQWTQVPVPALVDEKMQAEVRVHLARNKVFAPRKVLHDYLLQRLVVCGECGWKMACTHQKSVCKRYEYFYYGCERRDPVDTGRTERCKATRVRADALDAVVWDTLRAWLQTPSMLLQEVEAWRSSHQGAEQAAQDLSRVHAACRQLEAQIARLVDAYQQGALTVDELKARRERLEASLVASRTRADELAGQRQDRARLETIGHDLEAFAASLRDGLDSLTFAQRQQLVRLLAERVVVTGDDVAIEHAIPLSGRFGGLRLDHRRAIPGHEGPALRNGVVGNIDQRPTASRPDAADWRPGYGTAEPAGRRGRTDRAGPPLPRKHLQDANAFAPASGLDVLWRHSNDARRVAKAAHAGV